MTAARGILLAMPRQPRRAQGGMVFHAMNRGNCRMPIFEKDHDYLAFLKLMEQGRQRAGMRVIAYCLMPNHWHMVLYPRQAADLSSFFGWVCTTHVRRWRMHRHSNGEGHLYQGRFKSFPIQRDEHLFRVMRYVEANPVRAGLTPHAEDWPFSSLWAGERPADSRVELDHRLVVRPPDWASSVQQSISPVELERLHTSVNRGRPYGSGRWTQASAAKLGLQSSLRNPGRPRKIPLGDTE